MSFEKIGHCGKMIKKIQSNFFYKYLQYHDLSLSGMVYF